MRTWFTFTWEYTNTVLLNLERVSINHNVWELYVLITTVWNSQQVRILRTETKTIKLILHRLRGHSPKVQSLNLFSTTLSIKRRTLQDSTYPYTYQLNAEDMLLRMTKCYWKAMLLWRSKLGDDTQMLKWRWYQNYSQGPNDHIIWFTLFDL